MDYALAKDNLIIDNSRGVFFDNSNYNRFENNDVVDNDLAIQLMGSAEENSLLNNNFVNNWLKFIRIKIMNQFNQFFLNLLKINYLNFGLI